MIHKIGGFIIHKADYVLGAVAVSTPTWLGYLEDAAAAYVLLGGVIIVTVRAAVAIREWRRGRQT